MRHFHFKYIRNFIIILIALVFAGYPYLIITHYLVPPNQDALIRGVILAAIVLLSFGFVAYMAHIEHKKREKREQEEITEEPLSPRGF